MNGIKEYLNMLFDSKLCRLVIILAVVIVGAIWTFTLTRIHDEEARISGLQCMEEYPLNVKISVWESAVLADFQERTEKYYLVSLVCTLGMVLFGGFLVHLILQQEKNFEARRISEEGFAGGFYHAPIGMALVSPEGHWLKVNQMFCRLFGYSESELLNRAVADVAYPDDANVNAGLRRRLLDGEIDTYRVEKRYYHQSGRIIHGLLTTSLVRDQQRNPLYYICQIEDITARKQAEQQALNEEKRLRTILYISQLEIISPKDLLDHVLVATIEFSESQFGYIYYYNEETKEFTLHAWSQAVMEACSISDQPTQYQLDKTGIWGEAVRQRRSIIVNDFAAPHPLKKGYPDGHAPLVRFMTTPVFIDGKIVAVVGLANKKNEYTEMDASQLSLLMDALWNIVKRKLVENELRLANETLEEKIAERTAELLAMNSELEAANEELQRLTLMDGLTGVANRRYFDEYIDREWYRELRHQQTISLIMADIDFFKSYNDTYGHLQGDDCLKTIAAVLATSTKRTSDLTTRYGGEEFALVLPDTDAAGAVAVAENIRAKVENMRIENRHVPGGIVTISLGVASLVPSRETSPVSLIAMADEALYKAKHEGRNRVVVGIAQN